MKTEFLIAITQLSAEKNLPKEVVFQAVESALVSAFKKESFAANQNIAVRIHPATGEVTVYVLRTVVEEVTDPHREISLSEAKRLKPKIQLGNTVEEETTPKHAGRIAAQTAKQVVLQRLREAEREAVFEEYANRKDDVFSAVVQRIEPKQIVVNLGKAEAVLPLLEQIKADHYRVGQRLKVCLLEVLHTNKGPQLMVSRSHRNLLRRLFELEVPEIHSGIVELKSIAREAGFRSKVAVAARQPGVDPVGSCVGLRGIRIQNIVNELSGERIDVVQWHPDPAVFIGSALSPAQVARVEVNEPEKTATVIVPDRQLSLAIGREGQNARLAAKLTGWRIDIKASSLAEAEQAEREAQKQAAVAAAEEAPAPRAPEPGEIAALAEEVTPAVEAAPAEEEVVPARAPAGVVAPAKKTAPAVEMVPIEVVMAAGRAGAAPVQATSQKGQIRFAEDLGVSRGKAEARTKEIKKKGPVGRREEGEGTRAKKFQKSVAPMPEEAEEDDAQQVPQ